MAHGRKRRRMVARRLALAFFIAAALFAHAQASSWNVTSRMAAIESLVNRGTFAIDASPFKTGDKYRYAGHYYSDKPPILTVAGAGVALALRVARVDVVRQARIVMFAVTVVTVAIPFALGIAALFGLLRLLAIEARWAAAVATIAGSATLAFPFATVLINHVPAAALLLGAVYLLTRARLEARGTPAAGAGALLAVAFGIDTSFVIFILVAPLALGRASARTYLAYVAGTLPVLAVIAASDLALSGNIRPPDTNAPLFDWPGSEFAQGYIIGSLTPRPLGSVLLYGFNMLAGIRGLFLYSPILIFGLYALVRRLRASPADPHRSLYLFIAAATTLYVASAIVATTDYGGYAYGMRRFVGIAMLLCIPLGTLREDLRANLALRLGFFGLLAASTVFALIGVNDPFPAQPFPLLTAVPGIVRFTLAHRVHGVLNIAGLLLFGTFAYASVVRSLPATHLTPRFETRE